MSWLNYHLYTIYLDICMYCINICYIPTYNGSNMNGLFGLAMLSNENKSSRYIDFSISIDDIAYLKS